MLKFLRDATIFTIGGLAVSVIAALALARFTG